MLSYARFLVAVESINLLKNFRLTQVLILAVCFKRLAMQACRKLGAFAIIFDECVQQV